MGRGVGDSEGCGGVLEGPWLPLLDLRLAGTARAEDLELLEDLRDFVGLIFPKEFAREHSHTPKALLVGLVEPQMALIEHRCEAKIARGIHVFRGLRLSGPRWGVVCT